MKLPQRVKEFQLRRSIERRRAIAVSFTGGLGAQILSAAIYHHFADRGYRTVADLSYFARPLKMATPGVKGQITHWGDWVVDCYGVSRDSLAIPKPGDAQIPTLHDGPMKFSLALEALALPSVRAHFATAAADKHSEQYRTRQLQGDRYLCVHVRRGDFLNVASHLVSSSSLENIASRFAGLIDRILILSDSPIGTEFQRVRSLFPDRFHVIDDDPDPVLSHSLMRNAAVLICSNSQFSLSAGLLSKGLKIIPKVWYGANSELHKRLDLALDKISDFAVVT